MATSAGITTRPALSMVVVMGEAYDGTATGTARGARGIAIPASGTDFPAGGTATPVPAAWTAGAIAGIPIRGGEDEAPPAETPMPGSQQGTPSPPGKIVGARTVCASEALTSPTPPAG